MIKKLKKNTKVDIIKESNLKIKINKYILCKEIKQRFDVP